MIPEFPDHSASLGGRAAGWARRGLAAAAVLLLPACATGRIDPFGRSERLPQANDPVVGGAAVALAALRATAAAAVRQPLTTVKLGGSLAWLRPRELVHGNRLDPAPSGPPPPEAPGSAAFEGVLDRTGCPRQESGSLRCLVDGPGFFPEFERLVEEARQGIDVQVYIFDNDDIGVRCADALGRRSAGIPVRVLFDDIGTTFANSVAPDTAGPAGFVPPADMALYLRRGSQVRVRRTLNPWLVGDHTKLLVFDRRVAVIGGMNLGREYYSEWHDLMFRIEGPIVASMAAEFEHAWKKAGPLGDLAPLTRTARAAPPSPPPGAIPLRLLRTDLCANRQEVIDATLLAVRASRRRIWIETPYFASDEIGREIEAAARRGVDVRVILPSRADSTIMEVGNLATARRLIQSGGRVFAYPGMTHAKVVLCDGWATVGSANLDMLSLRINRELNVAFSDPATIRNLERAVFLPDLERSRLMTLAETESPIAPLAESIADQL